MTNEQKELLRFNDYLIKRTKNHKNEEATVVSHYGYGVFFQSRDGSLIDIDSVFSYKKWMPF